MKRHFLGWVWIAGIAFCATACDQDETVRLSGEVSYDAYTDGVIVIKACESESTSHDGFAISSQTPGECVAETVIEGPGTFSFKATVSWADTPPDIDLIAYLVGDKDIPLQSCMAGTSQVLSMGSHRDLALTLKANNCPMRI